MMNTLKEKGFFVVGKIIPGLELNGKPAPYPIINDRSVRAGAGIMFVIAFYAFMQALYLGDFLFLKVAVTLFFIDFLMKAIIGSRFSPISYIADLIVKKQEPEYVGAIQKRFAWSIGFAMASTMMLLLFVFDVRGIVNLLMCSVCLVFMFFESSFGICVGCKIYAFLLKIKLIKEPEYKPVCPGNVCSIE